MKLVTRPRLVFLVVVAAIVSVGVWRDRRETPIREGRVVIDEAFLHRLETEDPETTHDPAVKALGDTQFKGELLRNMLRTGAVTVDLRRVDRDSVGVEVRESFNDEITTFRWAGYRRHRLGMRVFFSPSLWKDAFVHREYWEPCAYSGVVRDH